MGFADVSTNVLTLNSGFKNSAPLFEELAYDKFIVLFFGMRSGSPIAIDMYAYPYTI